MQLTNLSKKSQILLEPVDGSIQQLYIPCFYHLNILIQFMANSLNFHETSRLLKLLRNIFFDFQRLLGLSILFILLCLCFILFLLKNII